MNDFWSYFWPPFAIGLVVGLVAASIGFRRDRRTLAVALGVAVTLGAAGLWHGPFGAADRLAGHIDRMARESLDYYEMQAVTAHVHRGPLTRRVILAGPADDFQRSELARLLGQVPGSSGASWSGGSNGLPLIAEGMLTALAGFLLGTLFAYLIELRRRYNAQWTW